MAMVAEPPRGSSTGPGSISSLYSSPNPHSDMSVSSPEVDSPALLSAQYMAASSSSSNSDNNSLRPYSLMGPNSAHLLTSPISDIVGPSPVTSNGTETTEIEDDMSMTPADAENPQQGHPALMLLRTQITDAVRRSASDEVVSVIHAPRGFQNWKSGTYARSSLSNSVTASSASEHSAGSPPLSEPSTSTVQARSSPPATGPALNTSVHPVPFGVDAPTPLAQDLREMLAKEGSISRPVSSLELIPESQEGDEPTRVAYEMDQPDTGNEGDVSRPMSTSLAGTTDVAAPEHDDTEIGALKAALEECWTLCNTLANLSAIHRLRVFRTSGTPDAHERAWKTCWKLCKRLYSSRNDTTDSFGVRTNLDLCRDFCQALFDVRHKGDEAADSVLRVSFELNTHLYSAQDSRNLPEAFRERTLDFYITLCHRLMKQRMELAEETDALLRACWCLAEMLFKLREARRGGRSPDEELLGAALDAALHLCDIFREGWTQIRPDRRQTPTPRPQQTVFRGPVPGPGSGPIPQPFPSWTSSYSLSPPTSYGFNPASAGDMRSNAGSRSSRHSKRDSLRSSHGDSGGEGRRNVIQQQQQPQHQQHQQQQHQHQQPQQYHHGQLQEQPQQLPYQQRDGRRIIPETPVTEFEDTPISPRVQSPAMPNIYVVGSSSTAGERGGGGGGSGGGGGGGNALERVTKTGRWSSSASNLSSYSQSSAQSSAQSGTTAVTMAPAGAATSGGGGGGGGDEGPNLVRIKALVLKAAMNLGFSRDSGVGSPPIDGGGSGGGGGGGSKSASASTISGAASTGSHTSAASAAAVAAAAADGAEGAALQAFVGRLHAGSFGLIPGQAALLQSYKNLVLHDPAFSAVARRSGTAGSDGGSGGNGGGGGGPGSGGLDDAGGLGSPPPTASSSNSASTSSTIGIGKGGPHYYRQQQQQQQAALLPPRGIRVGAEEMALSVSWMGLQSGGRYAWLRDLFRLVFGFQPEEAQARRNVSIAV